uniref:Aldo-keto reductase 1a n=1 Tax=Ciona intestinalis TaxID=7719 RepID=F6TRZ9_CIOIN
MKFVVICLVVVALCCTTAEGDNDDVTILPYEVSAEDLIANFIIPKRPLIVKDACKNWPLYKMLHNSKKLEAIKDVKLNTSMVHHSNYAPLESTFGDFVKVDLHGTSFIYDVLNGDPAISKSLKMPWMISSCSDLQEEFKTHGDIVLTGSKTKRKSSAALDCTNANTITAILSGRSTVRKMGKKHLYELVRGDMLFTPKGVCLNVMNVGTFVSASFSWTLESDELPVMAKKCARPSLRSVVDETWVWQDGNKKYISEIPDVKLNSGYMMPPIGLGTARLFSKTYETVKTALKLGYRMLDTAQIYTGEDKINNFKVSSEEEIGRAIADSDVPRSELFIVTKLAPESMEKENAIAKVEESLKKLRTDYIDLLLIHDFYMSTACGPDDTDLPECKNNPFLAWKTMEEMQAKGLVRSIGVSNIYIEDLQYLVKMAKTPISAVQNWFDPLHQEREIRALCAKNNIRFMGYSALGFTWIDKEQGLGRDVNPVLTNQNIVAIGNNHDLPTTLVVLRWAMEMNVTVMPCTTNVDHLEQNLNSRLFPLDSMSFPLMDKLDNLLGDPFQDEELPEEEPQKEEKPETEMPEKEMPSKDEL